MSVLQSITKLSENEIKDILDTIHYVFFDIDGVLVTDKTPIPGAVESVSKLRKLGKKIVFVTNNSVYPTKSLLGNLTPFEATEDEIVTPNASLMAYLKQIDFKKDIYVIGPSYSKQLLKEAGYTVIDSKDIDSNKIEETVGAVLKFSLKTLDVCKNVGAVLVDLDFNFDIKALQAAKIILNHIENVLLLSGVTDDLINMNETMKLIGSQYYIKALEKWTNKKAIEMAKPGIALKGVLTNKFKILDDNKVLFIGDNVNTDIEFGVNCGYRTCLALSGITTKDQVEEWKFPEHLKPTYVIENLAELYDKIKNL